MGKKYIFHPISPDIAEYEALYAGMAEKGWLLEKRGLFFSRFYSAEPQKLQYRVEPSFSTLRGEDDVSERLVSLFEKSGWTYVCGKVGMSVFSAPEGTKAPDVYSEPERRKVVLKILRRNYRSSLWILMYLLILSLLVSVLSKIAYPEILVNVSVFRRLIDIWQGVYYEQTALVFLIVSYFLNELLYSIHTYRIYRRFKKQSDLDREPSKSTMPYKAARGLLIVLCLVFLGLSIAQWAQKQKYEMPLEADGPYLLLRDLGWEGERSTVFNSGPESSVILSRSLLIRHWDTYECVAEDYARYWMYQDVYEFPNPKSALRFAEALKNMPDSTLTEDYRLVKAEGLDLAYRSGIHYLAVKDNLVFQVIYYEPGSIANDSTKADVFAALAAMLARY